jgi:putative ABC transport system permease protein
MRGLIERTLFRVARTALPREQREWMLGDLEEEHARLAVSRGRATAALWLTGEILRNTIDRSAALLPGTRGVVPMLTRDISQDVRYGARLLARSPGFTATIVLTLALGIGANTAIFSVVDALLFRPLPYPSADRLYAVTLANDTPLGMQFWPHPKYAAFARVQEVFDGTAAYARQDFTINPGDQPQRVEAEIVTPGYFALLGIAPALGRLFTAEEQTVPARDAVVILSDALWRGAFAADPRIVGRTIAIKDRAYTIVGVMPSTFRGQTGNAQLWVPVMMADHFYFKGAATQSSAWWMRVVARLRPGIGPEAAAAQMPAVTARVQGIAPSILKTATRDGRELFQLVRFRDVKVDPQVSRSFLVLLAAVGFVLLIACANTANLLLGRAVARQAEFAIRGALGASRGLVMRQVLIESLLLALMSGAAAMAVSFWTLRWLSTVKPMNATGFWSQYARTFDYFEVALDPRVAVFNFTIALGVGVLFGLLPAWQASKTDLHESLKQRAAPGAGRLRARGLLVLAEIAVSLMLLICAGLMVRSFARAASADLGFEPAGVVTMTASIQGRRQLPYFRELLERMRGIPGIEAASLAAGVPISDGTFGGSIEIEGQPKGEPGVRARINVITPAFFDLFSIRRVAGRLFSDEDRENTPRAAIVSRAFAQAAWPGQDPIGRHVRHGFRVAYGDPKAWITVVGVVEDVAYGTLEEPRGPTIYMPAWQPLGTPEAIALGPSTIVLRTALPVTAVVSAVRAELRALDSTAPLYNIATMTDRAAMVTARYRYSTAMMTALAVLALMLAAIGTYGVMAYAVTARTREIGIRVALGARPGEILRLVLGGGMKLTAAGLVLGLAAALAASRILDNMLYGVTPHDPATFVVIAFLMLAEALLAAYLPARRAMRVDPVVALRTE